MPVLCGPVGGERDALLAFLEQQRAVLRLAAYGLTDEQARATPSASSLSVGGLIKHVASAEQGWVDAVVRRKRERSPGDFDANFRLSDDETLAQVLAHYSDVAADTADVVGAVENLSQPLAVSKLSSFSVRWLLLHLITETARHAGHADIIRESLDGATSVPLMAAAERWPESPSFQTWRPPA